ncbi:F-box domain-containing protein [Xylariaceae sp. FL1651]|nr:F-box domain-containing protein [Xylariaceae sp. FL1651]
MGNLELLCIFPSSHCSSRGPSRRKSHGNSCMATPSIVHHPHQRWSLDRLSTELLVLILQKLGDADPESLAAARLLSTRFNAITTPIKYYTLRLTERIIAPQAETYFPDGLANIYTHTRHVKVDNDLNPEQVKEVLNKIERLSSVRWRYVQDILLKGHFWVPADILNPRHIHVNRIKLYIENLPLRNIRSEQYNPYLRAIPTEILVSLKMANPTPPLTTRLENLKGLLQESTRLETFSYEDRGQGSQFTFTGTERLPAFKDLSLRSYDWNHTADAVRKHWDFSEIRHLEMVDVPMFQFLTSVLFSDFQQLETLRLEDFSTHLPDRRRDATRGQYILIKQIRALIDLKITCHIQSFPVDGILHHARSLRSLCFRDYVGFSDEYRRCPTLRIEDLNHMSRNLVNLRILELDMDEALCEPTQFLRALCNFRHLDTLILHTQTVLDVFESVNPDTDPDHRRAVQMFITLDRGKQGASWRSITINVGGWKRIMVRRLSAPWREQNSRGVYAERCFKLERNSDGHLLMHEEPANEPS